MEEFTTKWIKEISRDQQNLYVQLENPNSLDTTMFERMASDDFCLSCVLRNREKGIIMYSIPGLVSLHDFLKQVTFEKEDMYIFLNHLFQQAIACNRNKPVLLDADYIFLNEYGDTIYFLVVPISVSEWMLQKERTKKWIEYLYQNIQTHTAFECIGYLVCMLSSPEFSLPNLILGLKNLQRNTYPKKFSFLPRKSKTSFRISEPVHPLYQTNVPNPGPTDSQTRVLDFQVESKVYLENKEKRFEITKPETTIGRNKSNDIQLPEKEISSNHAKIISEENRYYIQDLKSSNGTFLNDKRIQRKMRLKDGMTLRLANQVFTFHQQ